MSETKEYADALHRRALVIDCHTDTPQRFLDENWCFAGQLEDSIGHVSLEAAVAGGLNAEFFVAWVDPTQYGPEQYVSRTLELIDAARLQALDDPDRIALCTSADEIEAAHAEGRFAMLLAVEGGHSIADSLAVLRSYYALGARYMTLTWANSNRWAESSTDLHAPHTAAPCGLTSFGCDVVREMNRLGMMIDVSHSSEATVQDVLRVSRAPVLATHSSARALCDSPRNLTDEQIRAIAAHGGAVMVNFYSAFVDDQYRQAWNALRPEREAAHRRLAEQYGTAPVPFWASNRLDRELAGSISRPSFESLMAHFKHMIEVAGVEHVGIGTDFDGIPAMPEGIDSAADLGKITEWLLRQGYSEEDVRKVLGGNLMRVLRAVEAAAG